MFLPKLHARFLEVSDGGTILYLANVNLWDALFGGCT